MLKDTWEENWIVLFGVAYFSVGTLMLIADGGEVWTHAEAWLGLVLVWWLFCKTCKILLRAFCKLWRKAMQIFNI